MLTFGGFQQVAAMSSGMEFSSLEYFIKVINEHIWVIAGYPLMQFDVNGVQFRILTICKIIRSQFSEQVAAPRDWKHYVPIVYLIVNLHLLHNAHRNLDNQLGANNIITAPTLPLLWCYAQPRHGAGPRRAVIMWILWVESHKPAENVQLVASHLPRMSCGQAGVLTHRYISIYLWSSPLSILFAAFRLCCKPCITLLSAGRE